MCLVDGSFCNKFFLRELPANTTVIARTRKDIKIFRPAKESSSTAKGGRYRIYGEKLPTPDQIRKDKNFPWHTDTIFAAGKYHELRYKVVAPILWQRGTREQKCRLIIIAPLRYRKSKNSRLLYRDPAYLLVVGDQQLSDHELLQSYFLRWDIEVNHHDEKSLLGLGDAQLRSEKSVKRNPQFTVLVYSLLLLASILAYGPYRTDDYLPPPKWYKRKTKNDKRPSTLDIIAQFRREIINLQLEKDLEENNSMKKNKKNRKKPRSLIEGRKRGFVDHQESEEKPIKLPVNILAALLYADS